MLGAKKKRLRRSIAAVFLLAFAGVAFSWFIGSGLLKPAPSKPLPPAAIKLVDVEFVSDSGSLIKGWFFPATTNAAIIVLMHGVRGNRADMNQHARFLHEAGFQVLSFDFQAHGESVGDKITSGYLESMDAKAAVDFARHLTTGKIGIIGSSLGGAATLLAGPKIGADALVLEMVYPTLEIAVKNRIAIVLGDWARFLSPLLTWQMKPRLRAGLEDFRVIDQVRSNTIPKLFIAGSKDRHTTLADSRELFAAAAEPKILWVIDGAGHENLHGFTGKEYERRILDFFELLQPSDSR